MIEGSKHLVHRLDDPVDAGVAADRLVLGVNEDDLEVLVSSVLVNPVGVYSQPSASCLQPNPNTHRERTQHAQVSASPANTLLSSGPQRALVLELVDTLVGGLSVGGTLGDGLLAVSTADTDTVDNVALLGLVTETASLVGARRARRTVDHVQGTVLPAADTEQEAEDVRLLLLRDLFDVLEGSHLWRWHVNIFARSQFGDFSISQGVAIRRFRVPTYLGDLAPGVAG
jgi:hypothetical protein